MEWNDPVLRGRGGRDNMRGEKIVIISCVGGGGGVPVGGSDISKAIRSF